VSNFRRIFVYDPTNTNGWDIDANNNAPVVLYDSSGNEVLVIANPGFVKVTDGTNTQPTMDDVSRAGYQKVTDGTEILLINTDGSINTVLDSEVTRNSLTKQLTYDQDASELLWQILCELKRMNIQLETMTDEHINTGDISC